MPRLSVLLPMFNASRFLDHCLQSLAAQTCTDWQLVVVDDGSRDDSVDRVHCWRTLLPHPVKIHRFPFNLGLTRALHYGLALCDSEYVARHDADDTSDARRLATQVAHLDAHPACVLVGSRVRLIDESGESIRLGSRFRWFPSFQMQFGRNPLIHGSVMFRRAVAERAGGYLLCFEYAQDFSLWKRMARHGRIAILPQTLYQLRIHPCRMSATKQNQQRAFAQLARWTYGR